MTNDETKALLESATVGLPYEFRIKAMFGGLLLYANAKPLAVWANGKLGIKLDLFLLDHYKSLGAVFFAFSPKDVSKQYLEVPASRLSDPQALREWLEEGADYVTRKHKTK